MPTGTKTINLIDITHGECSLVLGQQLLLRRCSILFRKIEIQEVCMKQTTLDGSPKKKKCKNIAELQMANKIHQNQLTLGCSGLPEKWKRFDNFTN